MEAKYITEDGRLVCESHKTPDSELDPDWIKRLAQHFTRTMVDECEVCRGDYV